MGLNKMMIISIIMSVIVPLTMVLCGIYLKRKSDSEINGFSGSRTRRSMASREAWEFANRYCGELWIRWSFILFAPSVLMTIFFSIICGSEYGIWAATVIEMMQVLMILLSIFCVERQLKLHFDENGTAITDIKENEK